MRSTVELSMYPFNEDYKTLILDFIARLNGYPELQVSTGPTATVITAEHDYLFKVLGELLAWSHERHGRAVFVAKCIPDFEP